MTRSILFAVPVDTEPGLAWKWRTVDGRQSSDRTFVYFYECMTDAHGHGHYVDLAATIRELKWRSGNP
jgi:hypothetical protein